MYISYPYWKKNFRCLNEIGQKWWVPICFLTAKLFHLKILLSNSYSLLEISFLLFYFRKKLFWFITEQWLYVQKKKKIYILNFYLKHNPMRTVLNDFFPIASIVLFLIYTNLEYIFHSVFNIMCLCTHTDEYFKLKFTYSSWRLFLRFVYIYFLSLTCLWKIVFLT